jgi:hypothetical protein
MPLPQEPVADPYAGRAAPPPPVITDVPPSRPRTPAEQADFNARVQATIDAKRIESEKAEVEAAAAAQHDARVAEIEAAKDAEDKAAAERQAEAEKQAARAAHPHNQLRSILQGLQAPTALDVNGRLGALQVAVIRLMQVILQHTPPPPEDDNGERIERRDAEGFDEQITPGV